MKFLTTSLQFTISLIDKLNDAIGKTVSWLVVLMVVVTFSIVVMRYLFNSGSIQAQESVIYMHAILFMLAAASTFKQDAHVRVDIFYGNMPPRKKAVVNLFGNLFMLLPVCLFILWSSWDYVASAWEVKESSREAGGLPWLYLLKTVIPVFTVLLILQSISEIFKSILTIFSLEQKLTRETE